MGELAKARDILYADTFRYFASGTFCRWASRHKWPNLQLLLQHQSHPSPYVAPIPQEGMNT